MRFHGLSAVVLAAGVLGGWLISAGIASAEDNMTGAELSALLAGGKTIKLGGPGTGYNGELALNADGTGKGGAKTDDGKELTITGTWKIKGDTFCRTWAEVGDGKEVCETWQKSGDNKVNVLVDGESIGTNYW